MNYDQYSTSSYGAYSSGSAGTYKTVTSHDPGNTSVIKPVNGVITSDFTRRINPVTGKEEFHPGIDIAANAGTDIGSATSGKVTAKGYSSIYGNYVEVTDSAGNVFKYAHMESSSPMSIGSSVSQGQWIGDVGSTGWSTGNHLHLEVKNKEGVYLDPVKLW